MNWWSTTRPWKITGNETNRFIPPAKSSCRTTATNFSSRTFMSGNCHENDASMSAQPSRRTFLKQTALGTAGFWLAGAAASAASRKLSANDKLNIGVIGVSNRGGDNLNGVAGENIVALCDIDDKFLGAAAQKFPAAKTYNDFRRLLDQKDIDAVVISTPDHTHAIPTTWALKSGRHVYCEKPLTHTISEARIVTELARKHKRVTQ